MSANYRRPATTRHAKPRPAGSRGPRRGKAHQNLGRERLNAKRIETGDDLFEWVMASAGKGLGLAQKER
jgi:hypothetical protein